MEEKITTTEATESTDAIFDEGWGNDTTEPENAPDSDLEGAEAGNATDSAGVDQIGGDVAQNAEPEKTEPETAGSEEKAVDQRFTLKHHDEERTVDSEEVVRLAQKGLDYDKQKADYEAFQGVVNDLGGVDKLTDYKAFLEELAANSNMSVQEVIDSARAANLSKKDGISIQAARQQIELNKREKALSVKELAAQKEASEKADRQAKIDAEFSAFAKEYPDIEGKDIPKEVWDEFGKTGKLTDAYRKHELSALKREIAELRKKAETAEKNSENRQKAAPSAVTAGQKSAALDPFDEAWDED